jgi:predicted lipoprotein with Yx(FWY)xxD motif
MDRTRIGSGSVVRRTARGIALVVAATATIAACSSSGGAATVGPATAAPATTAPVSAAPATGGATTGMVLELRTDPALGAVVAGKDGMSLYVFTKDTTPGKSACEGSCANSWPALTAADAGGVTAGSGVTGAVGTFTRTDGSLQVTLGGAPLYYFAGDSAAGETNGQGLNDVWYLASPMGTAVKAGPAATTVPGETKCSGGPACY